MNGGQQGKPDADGGAFAGAAFDGDAAAHGFYVGSYEEQPEAQVRLLVAGGAIGAIEGLEDVRQMLGGNSDAGVLHHQLDAFGTRGEGGTDGYDGALVFNV